MAAHICIGVPAFLPTLLGFLATLLYFLAATGYSLHYNGYATSVVMSSQRGVVHERKVPCLPAAGIRNILNDMARSSEAGVVTNTPRSW